MNTLFALLVSSAFAGIPAGQPIDDAVSLDITPEGFNAVKGLLPMFIPAEIPLGGIDSMPSSCLFNAGFEAQNLIINIELDQPNTTIVPRTAGAIDLHLELAVGINDPGNQFSITTDVSCIQETCNGWIDPFLVEADTTLYLDLSTDPYTGETILDAYIDGVQVNQKLSGSDITLQGCFIGGLADTFGLFDLLVPLVDDAITGALDDAIADLNDTLAATLSPLTDKLLIQEELDLGDGQVVSLFIEPQDLAVVDEGLRFALRGGAVAAQAHPCIAEFDPGSSLETPSDRPDIGEGSVHMNPTPPLAAPHHLGALVRDEFLNQVTYAVWQTGILCQELGGPGPSLLDLPLPIDTTLLSLLAPGVYDDLFPESQPILLKLRPENPPIVEMNPDDIDVVVPDLGIEIYSKIDGRQAKIVDVATTLNADLDLSMDTVYGVVGIGIGLDDALTADVLQNEFVPGSDDAVADGIEGLLANPAIAGLVGDALGGLGGIGLPPIEFDTTGDSYIDTRVGIQDMDLTTGGDIDDWLGAYMWLGEVDYEYAGCSSSGCGDSGCGGSSTTKGCDMSGCDTSGCTDTSGCANTSTTGPAEAGCDVETSDCGCNLAGTGAGRILALVFTVLVIARRRNHAAVR